MANIPILFIDLETCPSQSPTIKEEILAELKSPGNITKESSIAAWWQNKAPQLVKERLLKTSLDPTHGSIISIAYAFNDKPVEGIIRHIDESEKDLLEAFYEVLLDSNTDYLQWVAFPIRFDLPFLIKRSIINNTRPPIGIPSERSKSAFCPMNYWAGWHEFCSLDALCKALGIPGKGNMTGADVYPYVLQGRYDEILKYNKSDVEMLRQVFRRIHFLDWLPEDPKDEIAASNEEDAKLEDSGFFDKVLGNT